MRFGGGSEEKMMKKWFGYRNYVVGLPPLGQGALKKFKLYTIFLDLEGKTPI